MGLLVIYAVFITLWAIAMTVEYNKVVSYNQGQNDGKKQCCTSLKKQLDDIEWKLSGWNETK